MSAPKYRLDAVKGDITHLDVDAIVNAANEQMMRGTGVCGAIFAGAGVDEMKAACDALKPCPTGEARITPGFRLRAQYVIHAVGPVYRGGGSGEAQVLESTYKSALSLADQNGVTSIAFPAISTGVFGYPLQLATNVAVNAVKEYLFTNKDTTTIDHVIFSCFDDHIVDAYASAGVLRR